MPDDIPILAKITITQDDYRQIRKLYKEMPQQTKDAITAVIKARQRENCDRHISDLLAIMAVFAKFTTQKRDRDLIIKTFNLDDSDFLYLTAELAPADGGRDVVCTIQPDDQQPELFPMSEIERNEKADKEKILDQQAAEVEKIKESLGQRQGQAIVEQLKNQIEIVSMAQGAGYNAFQYATEKNSTVTTEPSTGEMIITRPRSNTNLKVTLTNYDELVARWRPSTKKLLEFAVIQLTAQNHFPAGYLTSATGEIDTKRDNPDINRFVSFTLEEWQEVQGAPLTKATEDETRERVKADARTILNTTLEWEEVSKRTIAERQKAAKDGVIKKRRRHWKGVNLVTAAEIEDNKISIAFSPEMANYLLNSYITQYPIGLLTIDDRNPNAYAIGRKLTEHFYNASNKRNGRNGILSVSAILECTDLPTAEQVKKNDKGNYKQRIIDPFIKALQASEKAISLQWSFSNAGGEDLRPDQHPDKRITDFESAYILFSLPEKPKTDKGK